MKFYFEQSNALILLFPTIVLVGLVVWFTYRSQLQQSFYTQLQRWILAVLRSSALILITILILAPAIQLYQTYKKKPLIIIASDNSESQNKYGDICEELVIKAKEALSNYRIERWTFGQTAQRRDACSFNEVRSDYSSLFQAIQNNYIPSSVSAMIILGDGIFNSGTDPVYTSKMVSYPIYTVGIGDTTQQKDAAILKVIHNQTAFIDDHFPIEINLSFKGLAKEKAELRVWEGTDIVDQRVIEVDNDDLFQRELFRLKAEKTGIVNYRVEISPFDGEQNITNNRYDFSIRVIDQKQKILIASNGANPDNAALIRLIEPQKNYKYKLIIDNSKQINPEDYDLVILNQLPDKTSANSALIADIQKSKRPFLWLTGLKTDYSRLNNLQVGFHFDEVKSFEYAAASVSQDFDFFQLDDYWQEQIQTWPPLQVPFADIELNGNWQPLAQQRIQQIDFQRALISLGRINGTKTALIAGEGIWKWRLYDFVQNGSYEVFDKLFLKLINYLILKPNEDNFNIYYQQNYSEDQEVTIEAELLDENYEPMNTPEVELSISAQGGTDYKYTFDKTAQNYRLNIGKLPVGSYSLEASVNYGGKQLTENGSFRINNVQIEQTNLQADFNTLYQISEATGGKFSPASDFDEILQKIQLDEHLQAQKFRQIIFKELIQLKWIVLIIILLFSMEWFLRKYWGSY